MTWFLCFSGAGKPTIEEDDEVPELVENFDEASKQEVSTANKENAALN